jgi:iron complex transport system ATP-binding protein
VSNVIELRAVSAGYGPLPVLKSVDLTVEAGERLAIVGPNGAGKSTLLRVVTGLAAPSSGEVTLCGAPVATLSRAQVARRVAVVPQVATLPFSARVEEVVALGRLTYEDPLRGLRERDRAAVAAAIDLVGLGRLVDRDARALSLGERQLVLLAVAVAQGAPVVVLDEPTVHLDIRHQVDVMELLLDLNQREDRTIVAVLHDLPLAARYFSRVIVLEDGRVRADAPPAEALTGDLIRDVFRVDPEILRAPWGAAGATPP